MPTVHRFSILRGQSFRSQPDLSEADFSYSDLSSSDFSGCNLAGASFEGSVLRGTRFDNADLRGATFRYAYLGRTRLAAALMSISAFLLGMLLCPPMVFAIIVLVAQLWVGSAHERVAAISIFSAVALLFASARSHLALLALPVALSIGLSASILHPKPGPATLQFALGMLLIGVPVIITIAGTPARRAVYVSALLLACLGLVHLVRPTGSTRDAFILFLLAPAFILASTWTCAYLTRKGVGPFCFIQRWQNRVRNLRGTSFRRSNLDGADFAEAIIESASVSRSQVQSDYNNAAKTPLGSTPTPPVTRARHNPDPYQSWQSAAEVVIEADRVVALQRTAFRHVFLAIATVMGAVTLFAVPLVPTAATWTLLALSIVCLTFTAWRHRSLLEPKHLSTMIWVRRFHHVSPHTNFGWIGARRLSKSSKRLQVHIETAAVGLGRVVTLGNSDVWAPSDQLFQGSLAFPALAALLPLLGDIIFNQRLNLKETALASATLACGAAFQAYYRQRTLRKQLTLQTYRLETAAALRPIRSSSRDAKHAVLHCPQQTGDRLWEDAIQFLADKVDIVIVVAEERSPSIEKELDWLAPIPPDCIVLIRVDKADLPENIPHGAHLVEIPARLGFWPFSHHGEAIAVAVARAVACHRRRNSL